MPKPSKSEADRFRGPAKWIQYVFARALVTLLQHLPVRAAYRMGRCVGWLCWKIMTKRRAVVRKNLEVVNAWMERDAGRGARGAGVGLGSGQKSIDAQVREVFLRAGANLFAGFTFVRMRPEQTERHLELVGFDRLKAALEEGRGAIILLAHMGPWEALAQLPRLLSKHGIEAPTGTLYRPLNNTYLDDWYKSQREAMGTRFFSRRDGFHKPVDFLRSGGVLGILADQRMRQGVRVPFFGVETSTTPIPGLFYRRTGAPLLAASVSAVDSCRWRLNFLTVELPAATPVDRSREALAEACNEALAIALSHSPCDGFWFQDRFRGS